MNSFINVSDLGNLHAALQEAFEIKKDRFQYNELGRNKTLLMIFFNNSLRTRLSTQKAAMNLGMNVIVLDVNQGAWKLETERGVIMDGDKSEHLLEAIPVMGCYCDLIGVRSFAQWMNAADVDFVITHPKGYELDPKFVGNATVDYDQMYALEGADFVYAKNWSVALGPDYGKIINKDMSWTIDKAHMDVTDNAYFMHCLPVRRNLIVSDEVIESPQSLVIPEAANREISATVVIKRFLEQMK